MKLLALYFIFCVFLSRLYVCFYFNSALELSLINLNSRDHSNKWGLNELGEL